MSASFTARGEGSRHGKQALLAEIVGLALDNIIISSEPGTLISDQIRVDQFSRPVPVVFRVIQ